jgi:hypothetical protein
MAFTGYRIYRGRGGPANVDFADCLAEVSTCQTTLTGLGHDAGSVYTYVVRPVLDGLETPVVSCQAPLALDDEGDWPGPGPRPVVSLRAEVLAGGTIRLSWRPDDTDTSPRAESFDILAGNQPRRDQLAHISTVLGEARHLLHHTLTCANDGPWYFTVRARSGSGVAAGPAPIIGPIMAAAPTCPSPSGYITDSP